MCGIIAVIRPSYDRPSPAPVSRMIESLRHRGDCPPSVRKYSGASMACVRVAIVDPKMGEQPMETATSAIVFNGEIYNHDTLRGELEVEGVDFRSKSDTEVLVSGYAQWGSSLLPRLRGMYAFVIVNKVTGDFFAARDPFGIKPLYYAVVADVWYFSSELGPLAELPAEAIKVFPPGSCMVSGKMVRFSSPRTAVIGRSLEAAIEELREGFSASVERHFPPGDDRVAIFCSGGIDSSALAYEAVQACRRRGWDERVKLALYSIGTVDAEDPKYAVQLARFLKIPCHVEEISPPRLLQTIRQTVRTIESFEPNHIRAGTVSLTLARRVRSDGFRIALVGEGADELLGGYEEFPAAVRRGADEEAERLLALFADQLHLTQLQRVDRTTMAFGIEARVPFLDTDFAQFVRSLPLSYKVYRNDRGRVMGKHILREAYRGLLPDAIVDRRKIPMGEGAGIGDNRPSSGLFERHADLSLSDADCARLISSYPRAKLKTKEETYYFSLFLERFGYLPVTENRPVTNVMATT
jgi:asparagine synthase (glutamine-hydrolysing)